MGFFIVILANCRRYIKNNVSVISMFFLPIFMVGFLYFIDGSGSETEASNKVAVINLDKGTYGNKLIKELKIEKVYSNRAEALGDLKSYKYTAVYEIPDNFSRSKKPVINIYKVQNGNINEEFENKLENTIKHILKINVLKKDNIIRSEKEVEGKLLYIVYKSISKSIGRDNLFPVINVIYLMSVYSTLFNKDLLNLKKSKILKRVSSTANYGYRILGGLYASMVIVQSSTSILSISVINIIFKYSFQSFAFEALNIILASMIFTSIAIMTSRTSEEYNMGSFFISLISLTMFSIYLMDIYSKGQYVLIKVLAKLTPFYWAEDSIKNFRIFPNSLILLLMALVFFTAGSVRDSTFAKNE